MTKKSTTLTVQVTRTEARQGVINRFGIKDTNLRLMWFIFNLIAVVAIAVILTWHSGVV